ncbi:transcriptional regulator [Heliobacterium gestii]|uniref:Transcriptional regulator n=2 Tax=Heliomicrobium gestii TaxID=2699 RepID=A0A845LFT9_HELGE|nr:transcriptional regulator [Heliomicrobium gestii]
MAEQNQTITVYSVASVGFFGFENGVFTKISGSGNIPTVITLVKDGQDNYSLLQYKEPMDGEGYRDSIHQMFPKNLSRDLFAGKIDTSDLVRQQENQAGAYLKTIGRKDPVQIRHVEKQFPTINVNASNKLFTDYCKNDTFLNKCPYWIGTREVLEDGARYIYETSQSKRTDGDDQIAFRKMQTTDHTIVKEKVYRIVGNEPVLESER